MSASTMKSMRLSLFGARPKHEPCWPGSFHEAECAIVLWRRVESCSRLTAISLPINHLSASGLLSVHAIFRSDRIKSTTLLAGYPGCANRILRTANEGLFQAPAGLPYTSARQ